MLFWLMIETVKVVVIVNSVVIMSRYVWFLFLVYAAILIVTV